MKVKTKSTLAALLFITPFLGISPAFAGRGTVKHEQVVRAIQNSPPGAQYYPEKSTASGVPCESNKHNDWVQVASHDCSITFVHTSETSTAAASGNPSGNWKTACDRDYERWEVSWNLPCNPNNL